MFLLVKSFCKHSNLTLRKRFLISGISLLFIWFMDCSYFSLSLLSMSCSILEIVLFFSFSSKSYQWSFSPSKSVSLLLFSMEEHTLAYASDSVDCPPKITIFSSFSPLSKSRNAQQPKLLDLMMLPSLHVNRDHVSN